MTTMGSLSGKDLPDEPAEALDLLTDADFFARLEWLLSKTNGDFNLTGRVLTRLIGMAKARASAGSAMVDARAAARAAANQIWEEIDAHIIKNKALGLGAEWPEHISDIITAHTHSAPPALTEEERAVVKDIRTAIVAHGMKSLSVRSTEYLLATIDRLTS